MSIKRNGYLVFGVGIYEEGKYKAKINRENTKEYDSWYAMIRRCYSENELLGHPTYKGCLVSKEFIHFQEYGDWFQDNYYTIDGEKVCLDKDILVKGNKIYSPDKCIFAPQSVNNLLTKRSDNRGKNPVGVSCKGKKFQSHCALNGKQKYLGLYDTKEEAFEVYAKFKKEVITKTIKWYENKIPAQHYKKIYKALLNYKIEITD